MRIEKSSVSASVACKLHSNASSTSFSARQEQAAGESLQSLLNINELFVNIGHRILIKVVQRTEYAPRKASNGESRMRSNAAVRAAADIVCIKGFAVMQSADS